jgi:hypothetical protein
MNTRKNATDYKINFKIRGFSGYFTLTAVNSFHMKRLIFSLMLLLFSTLLPAQNLISDKKTPSAFPILTGLNAAIIYVDENDHEVVRQAAYLLQSDIEMVSGVKPRIINAITPSINAIIIGSLERSAIIRTLVKEKRISTDKIHGKWEAYQMQVVKQPVKGVNAALVITGSDRRGTAYGVMELSRLMGVSPWYWWADVPVKKKKEIYFYGTHLNDAPKVKYRGIFINDEAPALSGWAREKFGGFNHRFYDKVFELILRLKGNYLWPAMWGNAFYDDDSLNIKSAENYAIVIGTSHHEPLMRAHDEWRRYGKGKWNYDSNAVRLREFWMAGLKRATNEKIVSVGMRGDGDEPMSRETATALLERIVKDQRQIILDVTGKPASETPQLWALYKEVQDYYDKGMRVPDDVTLLLCDDNWGNVRRLPTLTDRKRNGGYGIYYHFDYVGGPRNYKWINTNPLPRIWEQMHLAYEHGVKDIWIVNVGDIKPMEFPISFFLDYAWNPDNIHADGLSRYGIQWAAAQFGNEHAAEIAGIIAQYAKYNSRRKPELLDANTYHLSNYSEGERVTAAYKRLMEKAEKVNTLLPAEYRDAYFQLVLHPVAASANLHELYFTVAMNRALGARKDPAANNFAEKAKALYKNDSLITLAYHRLGNGKWNHMMSQTHIGYTYWQQPERQRMPEVIQVHGDAVVTSSSPQMETSPVIAPVPLSARKPAFRETDGYVSIEASHFTRSVPSKTITWKVLPDHGRTGSAVTTFPVAAPPVTASRSSPRLEYEIYTVDTGLVKLHAYFSPTLNFYNTPNGLQYAISIDGEIPQMVGINKEDNNVRIWEGWVANNIIIKTSTHRITPAGRHVIQYRVVDSGVVLQKLVLDLGGLKPSYLGPPETIVR